MNSIRQIDELEFESFSSEVNIDGSFWKIQHQIKSLTLYNSNIEFIDPSSEMFKSINKLNFDRISHFSFTKNKFKNHIKKIKMPDL